MSFQDIQLIYHTIWMPLLYTVLPCPKRDQTSIYLRYILHAIKNNQVYVLPSFPRAKNALQNFALALLMSWRGKYHYPCFTHGEI